MHTSRVLSQDKKAPDIVETLVMKPPPFSATNGMDAPRRSREVPRISTLLEDQDDGKSNMQGCFRFRSQS
jgi:hypothetical protein